MVCLDGAQESTEMGTLPPIGVAMKNPPQVRPYCT